jgi:hypothetical protein
MKSAKQGQRSFAVKLSDVPIVVFEDQLAGKENGMRKFGADRFGELRQLLYRVSAEAKISLRGKAPVVAEIDEVFERFVRIAPHRFQGLGSTKAHCVNRVKVSVVTTLHRSRGGQFVAHVAALPGNPYDGHTLASVIPAMQALIGNTLDRAIADAGYRGHNAPSDYKFRIFTAGQKRRVTPQIRREFRRRAAIEPVIGHLKAEHRLGRNHLAHRTGDAINAVLAAVGYNFHLLLRWLRLLLYRILLTFDAIAQLNSA